MQSYGLVEQILKAGAHVWKAVRRSTLLYAHDTECPTPIQAYYNPSSDGGIEVTNPAEIKMSQLYSLLLSSADRASPDLHGPDGSLPLCGQSLESGPWARVADPASL